MRKLAIVVGLGVASCALVACAEAGDVVSEETSDAVGHKAPSTEQAIDDSPVSTLEEAAFGERGDLRRASLRFGESVQDVSYEAVQGLAVFQSDMLLDMRTTSASVAGKTWSLKTVPYVIDPDLPDTARVTAAIAHWEAQTSLRFVVRTTESDYLRFVSATGCSSYIGRIGGGQQVRLSTGEVGSNIVGVAVERGTDRVHYFFKDGFYSIGTRTKSDAYKPHARYALPTGKLPTSIVELSFDASGKLVTWFDDGTTSVGTPANLAPTAPVPYTLPAGKLPKDIAGVAIGADGAVRAFYKDGTASRGTSIELGKDQAGIAVTWPAGRSATSVVGIDIAKSGEVVAWYSDRRISGGTDTNLGSTTPLTSYGLPGNCSTGSTIHEIGHAVGLYHEQTRLDRDQHVVVNVANITAGTEHNFHVHSASGPDHGAYDFASIMHYDSYAFSSNGQPTILKLDGGAIVANRSALSPGDLASIAARYP